MKYLKCRNFMTTLTFLTGWHLFTLFTVAPFLCIEAVFQKAFLEILQNSQVFSCKFYEISRNIFFHRTPLVAASVCTASVILDFCFILVASNNVIWVSLFGAHRFKLEVEDFICHVIYFPSILQRNFPNFGMEILALCSAKSFRGLFFLILFSCST